MRLHDWVPAEWEHLQTVPRLNPVPVLCQMLDAGIADAIAATAPVLELPAGGAA